MTASQSPQTPAALPDLRQAPIIIDIFERAARANLECPLRKGGSDVLPLRGQLVVGGDLHDHPQNMQRLIKLAQLDKSPDNHLILQEVIHGPYFINGRDMSIRTLGKVAHLKLQYPNQVHVLQSNHELAQLAGEGILKDGQSVVEMFDDGIDFIYGDRAEDVRAAMETYLKSLLLAVRCANGIFCAHSLPNQNKLEDFDFSIIDRVPNDEELAPSGPVYNLVWGRRHTQEMALQMLKKWNAKIFVIGHQPADMGYDIHGDTIMILASDHDQGHALKVDLAQRYDMNKLMEGLVELAGINP